MIFTLEDKSAACGAGLPEGLLALVGVTGCETEGSQDVANE